MDEMATINDIARFRIGQKAFILSLEDKPRSKLFRSPRIDPGHAGAVSILLHNRFAIEEFVVSSVERDNDGKMYYSNGIDWVLEPCLFDTKTAANIDAKLAFLIAEAL